LAALSLENQKPEYKITDISGKMGTAGIDMYGTYIKGVLLEIIGLA
jgi:hypothetical protein